MQPVRLKMLTESYGNIKYINFILCYISLNEANQNYFFAYLNNNLAMQNFLYL